MVWPLTNGKRWNPEGKHAYITGGSTGLGFELACLLVQEGAHVSIVARNQARLLTALEELEKRRVSPAQKLRVYSHSLTTAQASVAALDEVCAEYGGTSPDIVFACAGSWKPMWFVEMEEQDLVDGMNGGYWVQAWTAWAVAKKMAKEKKKGGKIVLVSSTLGYMTLLGWSSYSPPKHALRGLADTLQSELMLYGIDVHIFSPPTMFTPGYEEEQKVKPDLVKELESADDGLTAEQAARAMLLGVKRGQTHITGDLMTNLFRASTRGASPRQNWLVDGLLDMVAYVAVPAWKTYVDRKVVNHREEHNKYLHARGFFPQSQAEETEARKDR